MGSVALQTVARVSARLEGLLAETRRALAGVSEFDVNHVRALSACVREMAPLIMQSEELRDAEPEFCSALAQYKKQLTELSTALDQARVMLLAKRTQLDAGHTQLNAVSRWATALQSTR